MHAFSWLLAAGAWGRIREVFEWCCPATAGGHGTQLTAQFRFSVRLGRNDAVGLGESARLARTSRVLSHEPPKPSADAEGGDRDGPSSAVRRRVDRAPVRNRIVPAWWSFSSAGSAKKLGKAEYFF